MTPAVQRSIFRAGAANRIATPVLYRQIHNTRSLLNEPSKTEPAKNTHTATTEHVSTSTEQAAGKSSPSKDPAPAAVQPKKSIWEKVKHEANHYWDGTKLLGLEIKISFKLALKTAAGYELTRRERKQLQRTTQDMVRLVPFSMFVIVPFAELLLPVALKLFPSLLPSTYESASDKERKVTSLRDTRKKVSSMLRDTVKMQLPASVTEEEKLDFREFIEQLRSGMEPPSKEQTLRVARLFKDDTVLDNLERPQLIAMAKYLNLQPIGTNEMLRFRMRYKLLKIKNDDRAIEYEGVDSLTTVETQAACAARGIRVKNVNSIQLRHDLEMWIQLRLKERIPSTLLVLSNAYTYGTLNKEESIYDALQAVLSSMPEQVHHVVESDVDDSLTNKKRLELLKEQEEMIETETKQEADTGIKIQVKDTIRLDDDDVPSEKPAETSSEETTEGATKEGEATQDKTEDASAESAKKAESATKEEQNKQ